MASLAMAYNGLFSDNQGDIWLYMNCGLVEISNDVTCRDGGNTREMTVQYKLFDVLDGALPFCSIQRCCTNTDGRLWLQTD